MLCLKSWVNGENLMPIVLQVVFELKMKSTLFNHGVSCYSLTETRILDVQKVPIPLFFSWMVCPQKNG